MKTHPETRRAKRSGGQIHFLPDSQASALVQAQALEQRVRRFSRRRLFTFNTLGWSINDALIALVAVLLGYTISPVAWHAATSETAVRLIPCAASFVLLLLPIAHIAGLHNPRIRMSFSGLFVRCLLATSLAISLLAFGWILFSFLRIGRYVLLISMATTVIGMLATRYASWRWSSRFQHKIHVFGSQAFQHSVGQFVNNGLASVRIVNDPDPDVGLRQWAMKQDIGEIVFDAREPIDDIALLDCLDAGIKVSSFSDFVEENYERIPVENIDASWLFSARLDLAHPYYQGVKRLVDVCVAVVGLIVSAPLLALSAIVIKLESRGPVFYSQIRTGRFNRPFRIYKLRTMVKDSEKNGAQWATKNDSRITWVGKILRKTRLDELPQFWNVLKGDMSLIGPRPERPEFVCDLAEQISFYSQRHLVKPGLSGWAQVNYPYGDCVEDAYNKLTYDYYYIKNASIGLDLQIVLRTIGTVMKGSR